MSLLNDALRSAEQRRAPPHAPAAYPGQAAPGGKETRNALAVLIGVAVVATLVAFVLLWLWLKPEPQQMEPPVGIPIAESAVIRPERAIDTLEVASQAPEAVEPENVPASEPKTPAAPNVVTAQPESPEPARVASKAPAQLSSEASPVTAEHGKDNPAAAVAANSDASSQDSGAETPSVLAPVEAAPAVRQQRETPELADRRAEKSIRQALSAGQFRQAEALLSDILAVQPAPESRARLGRHLLVKERPEQALTWLTRDAAITDDTLRLLRARALLASGQSEEAVALLESNVPGVRQNPEYTVTLATLLQQQGRANDAAGRWAALIAHDDAKAVWWVGLAIALEADQQFRAAARAFEQAMLLPDLPPSLADYVRRRLTEPGAG